MTLPLRQLEGKYEILDKIREGGMGAIYKVRHRLLDEVRVIKVIRPQFSEDPGLQQRFLQEARTAIRLRHPNIAQLYDFALDEEEGTSYIVMEFIDGVTVEEMLAEGGPPGFGLALHLAEQGLRALGYLHHRGYIHRDIAPDNLMLTRGFDGGPLVKLIDLGIVKRLDADAGLTQTGMFVGKLRYASPEQFSGTVQADHRSDLYSFGILLYELLTGTCPIRGENLPELVSAHLFTPPLDFDDSDPEGKVAPGLREVVLRLLAKQPGERPGSSEEVIEALAPFAAAAAEIRAELDSVLAAASGPSGEGTGRYSSSGSTEGRVVRQIPPVTTPRPESHLRAVKPPADDATETRQVGELVASARLLVRLEQTDKAERELTRALAIDPDHREARELLDRVRRETRQRRKRGGRHRAAAEEAERAEREEAAAAEERERREQLDGFLAAAAERLAAGALEAARGDLRLARELARDDERIEKLEAGLIAAEHEREAEALREEERRAAEEAERKAREEAERRAREEVERKAAEAKERKAREEAERKSWEEAERKAAEARERRAREERERKAAEEAEQKAREEAERKARKEAARAAAVADTRAASAEVEAPSPPHWDFQPVAEPAPPPAAGAARTSGRPPFTRKTTAVAAAALAGLLALALAIGLWVRREPAPPLPSKVGVLVLDALPWAEVRAITDQDGAEHPPGADPYTPLHLRLPPGTYTLTLAHPGRQQPLEVEVEILAGQTVQETVELTAIDPEQYLNNSGL